MKSQSVTKVAHNPRLPVRDRFAPAATAPKLGRTQLLTEADRPEILDFLAQRPVHTVVMTSMIRDNGVEGAGNRGRFYGYRDAAANLRGVALIGHTTLVEARSDEAVIALALAARRSAASIHFMMSDGESIKTFWQYFAGAGRPPRLVCAERLFEMRFPAPACEPVPGLRLAAEAELLPIAEAHAEVAFAESGVNPLEKDRDGFLDRVLRRIRQQRVWIIFDQAGKLVFKADVVAETPAVSYLEGVYVGAEHRGKGVAARCLAELGRTLLGKVDYVCLLSNEEFREAHRAYEKAGFESRGGCVTIFT